MKKILLAVLIVIIAFAVSVGAQDNIEKKKIDFLISSVEYLKGAKFVRNGTEHDGIEAAKHLRMKLEKAGGRVRTVDDFIKLCASRSYISGEPYIIKFSDGRTIAAEKYLRDKLKEYH